MKRFKLYCTNTFTKDKLTFIAHANTEEEAKKMLLDDSSYLTFDRIEEMEDCKVYHVDFKAKKLLKVA